MGLAVDSIVLRLSWLILIDNDFGHSLLGVFLLYLLNKSIYFEPLYWLDRLKLWVVLDLILLELREYLWLLVRRDQQRKGLRYEFLVLLANLLGVVESVW